MGFVVNGKPVMFPPYIADVLEFLVREQQMVMAIKMIRGSAGLDLREAKDVYDILKQNLAREVTY